MDKPVEIETGGEFPNPAQINGLGELTFLYLRAPNYQHVPTWRLRQVIEPAIDNGHIIMLRQDGVPRAAMTWAFLDDDAEARLKADETLSSKDWISGDRLWIMDMVAPYRQGSGEKVLRAWEDGLRREVETYRFQRIGKNGNGMRYYEARRLPTGRFRWHRQDIGNVRSEPNMKGNT